MNNNFYNNENNTNYNNQVPVNNSSNNSGSIVGIIFFVLLVVGIGLGVWMTFSKPDSSNELSNDSHGVKEESSFPSDDEIKENESNDLIDENLSETEDEVVEDVEMIKVPVLNTTLRQDTLIEEKHITFKEVSKAIAIKEEYIVDSKDLVGKVVACGYVVNANLPIKKSKIVNTNRYQASDLGKDYTSYGLSLRNLDNFNSSIKSNTFVDIYIKIDGKLEKYIENVLVLGFATDDGHSCKINGEDFSVIYLALKENVYTNMVKADRFGYTFQISITEYKGNDKSIINPKIKKIIDDKKVIIQNECQDLSVCG